MNKPVTTSLFVTPASAEALAAYMNLFSGEDRVAADFGYDHYLSETFDDDVQHIATSSLIVAVVVAGMRNNLEAPQYITASDIRKENEEYESSINKFLQHGMAAIMVPT